MREPRLEVESDRAIAGGRRRAVRLVGGDEPVPGVLLVPAAPRPAPAALLLHGYSSDKERMASSVGRMLLGYGVASLAIDLPLHGGRAAGPAGIPPEELRNPIVLARRWRAALAECRDALRALGEVPEVDSGRIAIVGYSMGSFLALMVGADEPRVRALVLGAGGDLPADLPFGAVVRTLVDPVRAVRRFTGRPLLFVHGRHDRTILPVQAERLYAAAGEPKRLQWYNGGHWLPDTAIREAVRWLAPVLGVET
jgi:pimeloyl-ACP methyl ester carboxylesterase